MGANTAHPLSRREAVRALDAHTILAVPSKVSVYHRLLNNPHTVKW
jgi:hypothetical protein